MLIPSDVFLRVILRQRSWKTPTTFSVPPGHSSYGMQEYWEPLSLIIRFRTKKILSIFTTLLDLALLRIRNIHGILE